jgi:hypothetical protein
MPVKLLQLSRTIRTFGHCLFCGRQSFVQRDDQCVLAQNHARRRRRVARTRMLEIANRTGNLLHHACLRFDSCSNSRYLDQ